MVLAGLIKLHSFVKIVYIVKKFVERVPGIRPDDENVINKSFPEIKILPKMGRTIVKKFLFKNSHEQISIGWSHPRSHTSAKKLKPEFFIESKNILFHDKLQKF